jgi:hypothetical protein
MVDDRDTGDNQNLGKQETPKSPDTPPAPPAPNHNEPCANSNQRHTQNEPKEKWGHNPSTWMVVITFLLAVLGIITAVIFYGQWREMIGQTDLANTAAKQTRKDSADSSVKVEQQLRLLQDQVKAAKGSVEAVQKQTNAAIAAMQIDQRAWIGVRTLNINQGIEKDKTLRMSIVLENYGKSPAISLTYNFTGTGFCGPFPKRPTYPVIDPPHPKLVIMPTFHPESPDVTAKRAFAENDIAVLNNPALNCKFYAYARIVYFDTFKKRHWRHFCSYWDGKTPTEFISCAAYNDGDENYPNGKEP